MKSPAEDSLKPIIVLDAGNSRIKAGVWSEEKLSQTVYLQNTEIDLTGYWILDKRVEEVFYLETGGGKTLDTIKKRYPRITWHPLNHQCQLPFTTHYLTPESLGTDRIAALAAVQSLFPERPLILISAGTCITMDLLEARDQHIGGVIAPGIRMRLAAMHKFTARLPHPNWDENPVQRIGTDTVSCLLAGAVQGAALEVQGFIQQFPGAKVILHGGDAGYLADQLKGETFVVPDLTLIGLGKIWQLNKST